MAQHSIPTASCLDWIGAMRKALGIPIGSYGTSCPVIDPNSGKSIPPAPKPEPRQRRLKVNGAWGDYERMPDDWVPRRSERHRAADRIVDGKIEKWRRVA